MLIGVLYVPESLGPQALASLGVPVSALRQDAIAAATGQQESRVSNPSVPTHILAQALFESADVAHGYIGTEHLLLAVASAPVDVLVRYGISSHRLREAVAPWRGRVTEPALSENAVIPPGFLSDHEPSNVRTLRA